MALCFFGTWFLLRGVGGGIQLSAHEWEALTKVGSKQTNEPTMNENLARHFSSLYL